ncbi:MAG: GT2 family glycosyltransferase [Halioglobus sp.]|jgi:GT2 family glycosyltransferase
MKNCLIVLGMHRSGTSAFTGILDILGVNLGSKMLETQADNPKGFFENKFVVLANDCILDTLQMSWDDTFPLPSNWTETFNDTQLVKDIQTFLREDMVEGQLCALKDPRLSRLLPLWLPLFAAEDVSPHIALVIRHPLEIAQSLHSRNGFSTEKSLLLWMQHMLDAERNTRHLPRGFVKFESLLQAPEETVEKVFLSTGLQLLPSSDKSSDELAQFLDGNLRHHTFSEQELDSQCFKTVADYYRLLCQIAKQGEARPQDLQAIDALRAQFETSQALFYNRDILEIKQQLEERCAPVWYEEKLDLIKEQFDADKIYREYRYIANTENLYKERAVLLDRADHLEEEIQQFIGSPPWRVYKKYQETIEQVMPEGSLPRRLLQKGKQSLVGLLGNTEDAAIATEQLPEHTAPPAAPVQKVAPSPEKALDEQKPSWEPLTFAPSAEPHVSIVIPVFNNWHFTYKCLQSVHQHTAGSYEIIVVDNNSTDVTPELLASMQGIEVITNPSNEVFVNACNQAAKRAKGEYLLLLNNDTEVTHGWLEALLEPFNDPSTGIVGAKLVYPDGRLQEAGGIIWTDGNGCNYGHGDSPDLPQYNYKKAVDYCSGACLIIPQTLWREIGGFDQRYAPAYYEDTDLCFATRALNYKVIYQPRALVVHYGGASAGKETTSGYKRFQEINRHKFVEKWAEVLERDHVMSREGLLNAREKGGSKQILIIDHYVPTFDRDSGSQRMLYMLKILQDMDYKVSFWPEDLSYDAKYTGTLQNLGVETWYGDFSFEDFIAENGDNFDVVLMSRPATAKAFLHLVKKYSNAHTIFDTVDLHFVREERRLELEVQRWKNLEFFLAEETDTTLVVSPTEKALLSKESFADKVAVVSNIHSLELCETAFEERKGLMFIGGFAHPPNEEGIIWFIEYILPLIRRKIPEIHLTVVGSDPTERVLGLQSESVTITGFVEDVSGYFNGCKVFVSPLLHGAGVKGKIGQSFSYGLPVVTTTIGAEGMKLTDGHNAMITDSETEFANKVVELYTDEFLWQKISASSRQVIRDEFSPETIRVALEGVLSGRGAVKSARKRPVIVHCHLFKNAGTTLDWSLERYFGAKFLDHRDDEAMRRGKSFLGPYLEGHPELSAVSSHHVQFPLPAPEGIELLPAISLRHPIDRARSVYEFEKRQEANTAGAVKAKALPFADYIRWRMSEEAAPTIRNFHCAYCCSIFDREIGDQEYLQALAVLTGTPLLSIVERYDESMILLEHSLADYFPGIDLAYVTQNASPERDDILERRVEAVYEELGPELTHEFREKNHWDMKLYEDAQAIFNERMGSLGRPEALLENFQARCRLLSAKTSGSQ